MSCVTLWSLGTPLRSGSLGGSGHCRSGLLRRVRDIGWSKPINFDVVVIDQTDAKRRCFAAGSDLVLLSMIRNFACQSLQGHSSRLIGLGLPQ